MGLIPYYSTPNPIGPCLFMCSLPFSQNFGLRRPGPFISVGENYIWHLQRVLQKPGPGTN